MFVPGCTRCHQLHMSMWCPEPLMAIEVPKPVRMKAGNGGKFGKKEEMSSTTINSNNRSTSWKESTNFPSDNNNNAHMKNRNGSARRGRGGTGFRSIAAFGRPPPSTQAFPPQMQLMRNATSYPQNYHQPPARNVGPNVRRQPALPSQNSTRRNEKPTRHVRPPNEAKMRILNNELRPFSYGSDDMYEEAPMPKPTVVPRVPDNKMYVFRKRTYFNEKGEQVDERETATIVDLDGDQIVFVDLNDDFEF